MLFLLLSGVGFAQQTTINGSEHPELIPDSAAALAVFSVHSMFDTPANAANTAKQQAKIGLSAADVAVYNAAMLAYFNSNPKQPPTLIQMQAALSADGYTKLLAFVRSEKTHMQYHTQPPIPQEGN
ncbi:MAG: hypothetical protein WA188_19015 [Terriglobales bacterium]